VQTFSPTFVVQQGKGLTVTSADQKFQATFRSRIQLRDAFAHNADGSTNEVNVKTLRFTAQGYALVPELKYTVQLAFGTGDFDKDSSSPIFDAFLEYVKLRDLNVRVGQYFVPFDRARTIREFALQFVDRQLVVRELTLDRDVGIMLSSQDLAGLQGKLGYNLFVGSGDGRNRVADRNNPKSGPQKPGVLLIGRGVLRPMGPFDDDHEGDLERSPTPHLALGIGAGYNLNTSRPQSTYTTHYAVQAFQTGTFNYVHAAADVVFKWRGFSLLSEVLLRDANKRSHTATVAGEELQEFSREGYGYFVQAGQMVSDKLELTARWDDLYAKKGTDPALVSLAQTQGRQAGAGINYYFNKHYLKLQTDYFAIFGTENTDNIRHSFRVQMDASF
jgi:hypothetical protein